MRHFRNLLLALTLIASACDGMKPEAIALSTYPEIESVLKGQKEHLVGKQLKKEVRLESDSETQTLEMDTTSWKRELAFLEEINPNQPEYVGAFEETKAAEHLILTLGEKERGVLKKLEFNSQGESIKIKATIHEDKDVYVHHRVVELEFLSKVLSSYSIDGYQKIMLKDTVRFKIVGKVL